MPVSKGSRTVQRMYLGDDRIEAAYVGEDLGFIQSVSDTILGLEPQHYFRLNETPSSDYDDLFGPPGRIMVPLNHGTLGSTYDLAYSGAGAHRMASLYPNIPSPGMSVGAGVQYVSNVWPNYGLSGTDPYFFGGFWVKTRQEPSMFTSQTVFGTNIYASGERIRMQYDGAGSGGSFTIFGDTSSEPDFSVTTPFRYDDDLPHFIAFTVDDTTATMLVDGRVVTTSERDGGTYTGNPMSPPGIAWSSGPVMVGTIQDVFLGESATPVTVDQLNQVYVAGWGGRPPLDPGGALLRSQMDYYQKLEWAG